jgi:hypothetical protein
MKSDDKSIDYTHRQITEGDRINAIKNIVNANLKMARVLDECCGNYLLDNTTSHKLRKDIDSATVLAIYSIVK